MYTFFSQTCLNDICFDLLNKDVEGKAFMMMVPAIYKDIMLDDVNVFFLDLTVSTYVSRNRIFAE